MSYAIHLHVKQNHHVKEKQGTFPNRRCIISVRWSRQDLNFEWIAAANSCVPWKCACVFVYLCAHVCAVHVCRCSECQVKDARTYKKSASVKKHNNVLHIRKKHETQKQQQTLLPLKKSFLNRQQRQYSKIQSQKTNDDTWSCSARLRSWRRQGITIIRDVDRFVSGTSWSLFNRDDIFFFTLFFDSNFGRRFFFPRGGVLLRGKLQAWCASNGCDHRYTYSSI